MGEGEGESLGKVQGEEKSAEHGLSAYERGERLSKVDVGSDHLRTVLPRRDQCAHNLVHKATGSTSAVPLLGTSDCGS
jgi:hypothetical protein